MPFMINDSSTVRLSSSPSGEGDGDEGVGIGVARQQRSFKVSDMSSLVVHFRRKGNNDPGISLYRGPVK